jgi:small-conductance mechanosensitive channel
MLLELNGMVCVVQKFNLRTTTVLTKGMTSTLFLPADLTRNQLINGPTVIFRFTVEVTVGVDYSSDVKQ